MTEIIDFDVESTGLQWPYHEAFLYQFGDQDGNVEVIPATERERIQAWLDRADKFRAWNARFDRHFATAGGFDVPGDGHWIDGMISAHILDERRSVALKAVGESLGFSEGAELQKAVKDWLAAERRRRKTEAKENGTELVEPNYSDVPLEIMKPYAAEDIDLTRKVCAHQDPIIASNAEFSELVEFEHEVSDALFAIEERGFPADEQGYRCLEIELADNLSKMEEEIDLLAKVGFEGDNFEFNPRSSQQIYDALQRRGANLEFVTNKSMDAENLETVEDELARAILNFRSEFKVLSTYVRPMIGRSWNNSIRSWHEPFICPDGRIHANYRQLGARTGRMSVSDPPVQTQPRDDLRLRYNFRAEPGKKLVTCDLNSIEMAVFAAYAGEGRLLNAVREGQDIHKMTAEFVGIRDRARSGGHIESARQRGKTFNFCVPLDAEILTQTGWKTHESVKVGDKTLGYNPNTGKNEWTEITGVHKFDSAPLVEANVGKGFKVRCTPNHRWLGDRRTGRGLTRRFVDEWFDFEHLTSEHRIRTTAPSAGGSNQVVTPQDAAIVGWLLTDGCIQRGENTGTTAQGNDGRRTKFEASIYQKEFVKDVENALKDIPHFRYYRADTDLHQFRLQPQFARDLWMRCQLDEISLVEFVASLSRDALLAFMEAAYIAEGDKTNKQKIISQNSGEVADALILGVYLLGKRPAVWGELKCKSIGYCKPLVTAQKIKIDELPKEKVWCVTTDLGSWTMRQGRTITLTGNSVIYGAGVRSMRKLMRCNQQEARLYLKRYHDAYPEVSRLQSRVEWRLEDSGYIKSAWGRRFRLEPRDAYRAVNYIVQGTAADLLKASLIRLHKEGVPIIAAVHDELIAECDERDAEEVKHTIIEALTDHPRLTDKVPITADGAIVDRWSQAKDPEFQPNWAK